MFLSSWRNSLTPKSNRAARRRHRATKLENLERRELLSVTPTGATIAPTEGAAFTGTVATFTASDAGPFTATIQWGDGTTDVGSITGGAGAFSVNGTHTYADEGTDTITVSIFEDADASFATATGTANVAEGDSGTFFPLTFTTTEGQAFSGAVATFSDNNLAQVAGDWTATIDWGDSTTTSGTVTGGNGTFTISGNHTYSDEGTFTVIASFSDDPPSTLTNIPITSAAVVAEADALTPSGLTIALIENQAFSGAVATFSDTYIGAIAGDFSATINWGDGTTTAGTVAGGSGTFTVTGDHTYADDGGYAVSVVLADDSPGTAGATASSTANVTEGAFVLTSGSHIHVTEGVALSGIQVATFQDPGSADSASDFAATIVWGDGAATAGTITGSGGNFTVTGNHTYADELSGAYLVTVSEPNANFTLGPVSALVDVADADSLTAPPSSTVAGVANDPNFQVAIPFANANATAVASDFTATIVWGDGSTTAGTVSGSGTSLTVHGTHAYANAGAYGIKVSLADDAPGTASATFTGTAAIVGPLTSLAGTTISGHERAALDDISVATFQAGGGSLPAALFTATIKWGDGASSAGAVSESGGVYTVAGSHTYLDEGNFSVSVKVSDAAGSATASTVAKISEELMPNGTAGTPNQRFVMETYRDLLHRPADPSALAYWSGLLDQGHSRLEIVQSIIHAAMPRELGPDLVNGIYQKYLGRDADAGGLAFWTGQLVAGQTIEQVEAAVIATQEFFSKAGGTNDGFIHKLFQLALGRDADAAAIADFNAAFLNGLTREQAADFVFMSHEYHVDQVKSYYQAPIDADDRSVHSVPFIDDLDFLDRPADAAGLNALVAELDHGASDQFIWTAFLVSSEFYNKTG